jgi:hypothetical protein
MIDWRYLSIEATEENTFPINRNQGQDHAAQ